MAALSIRNSFTTFDCPGSSRLPSRDQGRDTVFTESSASLSHFRLFESSNSPLERGKDRPCSVPRSDPTFGAAQKLMSPPQKDAQDPAPDEPPQHPSSDARTGTPLKTQTGESAHDRTTSRSVIEHATPDSSQPQRSPVPTDHVSSSQTPLRSITMHAILNPEDKPVEPRSRHSSREPLESPPTSISPSTHPRGTPSPALQPPLEPSIAFERPGLSPRTQSRHILAPRSPGGTTSLVGRPNPVPGTINVTQSPFLQSPQSQTFFHEHLTRMNPDAVAATVGRFNYSGRIRSSSLFAEHRQAHIGSRPHSQDTSPSTPQSTYSPFNQTPPSTRPNYVQLPASHPPPFPHTLPPPTRRPVGELNRPVLSSEGGCSHPGEAGFQQLPPPKVPLEPGPTLIPMTVDLESGSRKADDKRKKNSDASKKFRERKKQGEVEQQQRLERQAEEIRRLTEEKDFYRVERDFFRDICARNPGFNIPARPLSPRLRPRPPEAPPQTQQVQGSRQGENRENYGRNVRPRLGSAPGSLTSHASFQSVAPFPPARAAHNPSSCIQPWAASRGGPPYVPPAPNPPALAQAPQSQPPQTNYPLPPVHSYPPREGLLPQSHP